MKKLVVLDFSIGICFIYGIEGENEESYEEFIESLGHSVNNCQWMITTEEITIG